MVNYENGKVYKIEALNAPLEEQVYIGSTTKKYLSQRMDAHRYDYYKWKNNKADKTTSFDLFDKYGIENCHIVLLESVPCKSKEELHAREAHYIRTVNCINRSVPLRTWKERRQDNIVQHQKYMHQYKIDNKEKIKEQRKNYNMINKEAINEQKIKYRTDNKEQIAIKRKIYDKAYHEINKDIIKSNRKASYEKNKEAILDTAKVKITCECGSIICKGDKSRHLKTIKHKNFIESKQPAVEVL
jgi:hypothetical protein